MVNTSNKTNYFIPLIISVVLAMVYYIFGMKFFLAGLVLAMGGFLSLINIKIAIYAITFSFVFLPNTLGLLSFIGLGLIYFIRRVFIEKEKIKPNIYAGIIGVYLLVIIIQTVTSMDPSGSIRDLGIHIAALMYLFTVFNTINTKEELNQYLTVLLASVTFVALIGILQAFTGVEIRPEWLDVENNPDVVVRVFSVFGNPNTLAEYLVIFTPLAVGLFWNTKNLKKKIVFGISVLIMLSCLILTMSRGGWIGIAMAALVFCILVDKRLLLLSIPLIFAALIVLPDTVINRLMSIGNLTDSSNAHRFNIWSITGELIGDYPVAGVGFGHLPFKEVYETYSRSVNAFHAHNSFIQTVAEIGFAGFLVFITMLITFIKYPVNALVNQVRYIKEDKYLKYVGVGVAAGLIGVFTHGLVENVLYLPKIIFSFWIIAGIGAMGINILNKETPRVEEYKNQVYKIYRRSELDV